jgi:hypothetical protein
MARKPRDLDAELKALKDRAKALKAKKTAQLGDLVTVAGASALDPEILAGALLSIANQADPQLLEGWRRQGREFFQRRGRTSKAVRPSGDGQSHAKGAADDRAR